VLTAIVEAGLTINPRHMLACAVLNRNVLIRWMPHVGRPWDAGARRHSRNPFRGAVEGIDPGLEVHWIEGAEI
jgi:hypothetical protein